MKNKVITAILAVGICGVAAFSAVSINNVKIQIEELNGQREQLAMLESEKAVMQEQLITLQSEKAELQSQVEALDVQLTNLIDTEKDSLVEQCIAEIESIGEVSFEDEVLILDLEATYSQMTEKQKNKLTNYVDLKNARRELDRLITEVAIEGRYEMLNDDWRGYYEFVPANTGRTEGEMLVYARSNTGYELEERMTYRIEDDMMEVDGDRVTVYVHNGNLIIEDNICEGEIPQGDLFEAKIIYDGDTLEFYKDGTAIFTDRPNPDVYLYERDGDILTLTQDGRIEYLYVYENKIYYDVLIKK